MSRRSILMLCTMLPLAACSKGGNGGEEGAAGTTAVAVTLAPVHRDTISEALDLVGRLDPTPGSSALLAAPTAAVVRLVLVQTGAEVQAGQMLVELDAPELAAQAQSEGAAAAVAERESARQQSLLAQGIASARQAEEAANTATSARAAADASAKLLARTRVTSPIEGDVNRITVQPGERVDAGAPLAEVMDADTLDLVVQVPAAKLPRLHVGQPAWIVSEGDTTRRHAVVQAVAPGIDSVTNAGRIVVRMPNPGERIHIGTGATATVVLGLTRDALVVPATALVLLGDQQTVFVVGSDSVAHARAVTVSVRAGARLAVTGALKPGENVVARGAAGLAEGMHVVPAPESK